MTTNWQTLSDNTLFDEPPSNLNNLPEGDKAYTLHSLEADGSSDALIKQAIAQTIEKASALLDRNIDDQSLFMMFEWDAQSESLTIAVSDDTKKKTSSDLVRCCFVKLDSKYDTQQVKLLSKDYLSTCKQFLRYSLVAMFHTGSREHCELL